MRKQTFVQICKGDKMNTKDNKKERDILKAIREDKQVRQSLLTEGLCTQNAYSRYENMERDPDSMLMHALMQRMGKGGDKLSHVLSQEEYESRRGSQ